MYTQTSGSHNILDNTILGFHLYLDSIFFTGLGVCTPSCSVKLDPNKVFSELNFVDVVLYWIKCFITEVPAGTNEPF